MAIGTAILSGINTAAVLTIAWRGGRWTGRVDTRLDHVEQSVEELKREVLREKHS